MPDPTTPPQRLVLDGVPKVRYVQDGSRPFALCLKPAMDLLGFATCVTACSTVT